MPTGRLRRPRADGCSEAWGEFLQGIEQILDDPLWTNPVTLHSSEHIEDDFPYLFDSQVEPAAIGTGDLIFLDCEGNPLCRLLPVG
jgi:hypothetical protein